MKQKLEHAIAMLCLGIVLICLGVVFFISSAKAGGRHDHGDTINQYNVFHKHHSGEDIAKGIAIGIVATCGTVSIYTRIKHGRWSWCGEETKPEPLPSPGPTPLTVAPDKASGVRLYQ